MIDKSPTSSLQRLAYMLVSTVALVTILVYSQDYIIPFILALILWFIIHEMREVLQKSTFIREKFPMWVQSMISFLVINLIILLMVELLYVTLGDLLNNIDKYQKNFEVAMIQLNDLIGIDILSEMIDYVDNVQFSDLASPILEWLTSILGDSFLILFYVLFLLIEESVFDQKLAAVYNSKKQLSDMAKLFHKMDKNIGRYLLLKTWVSLLTGLFSYFVMLFLGLEGAIFWAMLIFVLNYIPTVGSLIATFFPAFFAILQFGEFGPFLLILGLIGTVQVLVGNVIEPKLMGNSLNMSSLVVILSLTIWGAIWGVMGMILSVPITVMMIVIFEEIPNLRFIAVFLSEKGDLNFILESKQEPLMDN
jgi:predicted PurR-regulated permease PerM